jgi:hypothetical protein
MRKARNAFASQGQIPPTSANDKQAGSLYFKALQSAAAVFEHLGEKNRVKAALSMQYSQRLGISPENPCNSVFHPNKNF